MTTLLKSLAEVKHVYPMRNRDLRIQPNQYGYFRSNSFPQQKYRCMKKILGPLSFRFEISVKFVILLINFFKKKRSVKCFLSQDGALGYFVLLMTIFW